MAYLTGPLRWLGTGAATERAAQAGIDRVAPGLTTKVAQRIGDFVEGGTYAGAQSAGHGDDPTTVATNAAGGGLFSAGFGSISRELAPWAKALRRENLWLAGRHAGGDRCGTAARRTGANAGASHGRQSTRSLEFSVKYGMPPSQPEVRGYASKVWR